MNFGPGHRLRPLGHDSFAILDDMRLKGRWVVVAGIIPGEPLPAYSKDWLYTSADDEKDKELNPTNDPAYHSIFAKKRAEAMDYYLQVSLPQLNNWAQIEFVWF